MQGPRSPLYTPMALCCFTQGLEMCQSCLKIEGKREKVQKLFKPLLLGLIYF